MQIWFRKSKQSRRWMHLFRFCRSLWDRVCSTRSSMREASRYFCTDRMILIAHFVLRRLSKASTTLPKVPWPKSLLTWSANGQHSLRMMDPFLTEALTSVPYQHVLGHYIMAVVIVNLLVSGHILLQSQQPDHGLLGKGLTSLIDGTWTSRALMGGFGGGT